MSRCPHCQHEMSPASSPSSQCPACGRSLEAAIPEDERTPADSPQSGGRDAAAGNEETADPTGPKPDGNARTGLPATGLSSASEPETWNEDTNARTYVAEIPAFDDSTRDASAADRKTSEHAPQPRDLTDDDVVRMSQLWGDVDDEVPSGMTIKSRESDGVDDEQSPTLDVEMEKEFEADESSETYSPESSEGEDEEPGDSSVEKTLISDDVPPRKLSDFAGEAADSVSDTYLSDDFVEERDSESAEFDDGPRPETQTDDSASEDSAKSRFDQTVETGESDSAEKDEWESDDESAKTLPVDHHEDWVEGDESKTYVSEPNWNRPKTTEETPVERRDESRDSTERTLISKDLGDDQHTDSGSADGGRRTDPLTSQDVSGAEVAEGSGLTINLRSMHHPDRSPGGKVDYQILSLLGEGGMGKVYNARQTAIDRVVAVKMLKPKKSSRRRDQHTKFLAEAVVTGELDHPNIVPIYDVGRDGNDSLFYSMKNVTGNPWLDTIHQKSAHDNLDILMSVADAVAFAHARGVVHRDLKPENVMLGEFGEVLVMDWGLAMPTEKFHKQRGIVRNSSMGGTPAYMAPEMATGPINKIGPHSDIYLLGAILFEIVTGRPPHRGKNAMKCLMAAARNKIVSTEHTGELIEIAYKAMSADPKDRYKSVQEFQAAVRTYLAHSESITLATVAEDDLERAQKTDNYQDYAKAQFGFEEALKLWDGNKRAKSSLGAARLAYAHCAMDKGDYDLAESLLDPGDMAHDKLRNDIVKARDERDARQKRLEAAKRMGLALALLLFVVVSGAAVWINNERAIAEEAMEIAVIEKGKAEKAQEAEREARKREQGLRQAAEAALERETIALQEEEKQRKLAEEQRKLAIERRQQAVAQEIFAEIAAIYAEEQAQFAKEQEAIALQAALDEAEARKDEEEQRRRAEKQSRLAIQRQRQAVAQGTLAEIEAIFAEEQADYAFEQQKEALRQQEIAQEEREKALDAADAERLAKNEAIEAQKEEAKQRKRAEAQQIVASLNAIYADEQKLIAEAAAKAEREAKLAEEREAYISKVGLAAAKIEENSFETARDLLESTNPRFRNWEWGYLMHLCKLSKRNYPSSQRLEAVALLGNGPEFVVAGEDGLAEIRHIEESDDPGAILKTLDLPDNLTVYDVAVSPDGRLIALATDDHRGGYIKLWDRQQGDFVSRRFGLEDTSFESQEDYEDKHRLGHMDPVVSVQFSRDGTKLLTASLDESARVWNVETGRQMARLFGTDTSGHEARVWDAVFCPNFEKDAEGNLIRDESGQLQPLPETQIVTVSEDRTARVWVDETGKWNDAGEVTPLPPFTGHDAPIYSVACSPDGQYIATGGFGRRVFLWRPEDIPQIDQGELYRMQIEGLPIPQTPYRELSGHNGSIRSLEFGTPSEPGSRDLVLLTGSDDNTLKVWNVDREGSFEKINPVKTFRGHGGYVRDCVFNPEGTWILSVSHDQTAKRWSLEDDAETEVHLVNGTPLDGHDDNVDAVGFSFTNQEKKLVTASRDNTSHIYELKNKNRWEREHVLAEGHDNLIPAGVYFDGGSKLATAAFDNTARVWDLRSGTEKLKLPGTGYAGVVAASSDGRWILTGSDNKNPEDQPWEAKLWNARSGELLATFGQHSREVTAVAFANTPDANGDLLLATADARGRLFLWRFSSVDFQVTEVRRMVRFQDRYAHNRRITGLAFLPNDNRLVSSSYDKAVTVWDVATGEPLPRLEMIHPREVSSMGLTADGRLLVTTCFDNVVRLWNVETAQVVRELKPEGRVLSLLENVRNQFALKKHPNDTLMRAWQRINPDADYQQFLEQGGWEQGVEQLLTQIPEKLGSLKKPPRELAEQLADLFAGVSANDLLLASTTSASISPDGRYVVTANRIDRIVHGWRLPANPASNAEAVTFQLDDDLDAWATAFSPARARTDVVILGFSDARQWKLTETENNSVEATASITLNAQDDVASVSFSPDGEYLVTGARDKAARVWSVKTGRGVIKLDGAHTGPVNAAVWAPPGFEKTPEERHILTASDDQTAILWKLTIGEGGHFAADVVRRFRGHEGPVLDAAFSPDGGWIVTVSADRSIRLWNAATAEEVTKVIEEDEVLAVAFSEDGKRILTGSAGKNAVIWSLDVSKDDVALKARLLLEGHSARVTDVAFSPLEDLDGDGKIGRYEHYGLRAVTASADNTVIVWDTREPTYSETLVPKAKQVLALKRHNRPVNAVRFSPDGRYILTGSEDHRAILWPTRDWMAEKRSELEKDPVEKGPIASSTGQEPADSGQ